MRDAITWAISNGKLSIYKGPALLVKFSKQEALRMAMEILKKLSGF